MSIFPNLCLWRRSLRSNLGGIDPEKLYRATLTAELMGYEKYHVVSQEANKTVINMPMEEIGVKFVYSRQQEMKTFSS